MELTKQKNYSQTFDLASVTIKGMVLEERAKKAGADYQRAGNEEKITFNFFSLSLMPFPSLRLISIPHRRKPFPWSPAFSFCIT